MISADKFDQKSIECKVVKKKAFDDKLMQKVGSIDKRIKYTKHWEYTPHSPHIAVAQS